LNFLDDSDSMLTDAQDASLIVFLIQCDDSFWQILDKLKGEADERENQEGVKSLKKTLVRGFEIVIDESHSSRNNTETIQNVENLIIFENLYGEY